MIIGRVSAYRLGVLASAIVCLALLSGAVQAGSGGGAITVPDGPGAPLGPTPEKPPPDAQKCFEDYQKNIARCHKTCCYYLLWIHVAHDYGCLVACEDNAQAVFDHCMGHCGCT